MLLTLQKLSPQQHGTLNMNLIKAFKKQSSGTDKIHLKSKDIYAVQTGDYAGEMLIYIEDTNESHCFLSIPNMVNRVISFNKFKFAIDNNIVEKVNEELPKQVYSLCIAQYKQNRENK